jgi:hypothetical protein
MLPISFAWGGLRKHPPQEISQVTVMGRKKGARPVLMTMPPSSPPPAAVLPTPGGVLLGVLFGGGVLVATAYIFRTRLIEYFIWHKYRLRLRIESIARRKDGSYSLQRVRLLAPPFRNSHGERDACNIPLIEARFDQRAALRTFLPPWLGGIGASRAVGLDIDVHEPSVLVEFDNLELTDSNWRRLAREVATAPARGRHPGADPEKNGKKQDGQARRFTFERLSVVGNAHLQVVSRALNEVLIPDLTLSGGEVRLLELSRSPNSACSELERIAAQRMLAGNLPADLKTETRRRLEHYAKSVLSKTTEEMRLRSRERLERIDSLLRDTTKALDDIGLPPTQRDKLREQSQRVQKNLKRMNEWIDGLDRQGKPSHSETSPSTLDSKESALPADPSEQEKQ